MDREKELKNIIYQQSEIIKIAKKNIKKCNLELEFINKEKVKKRKLERSKKR